MDPSNFHPCYPLYLLHTHLGIRHNVTAHSQFVGRPLVYRHHRILDPANSSAFAREDRRAARMLNCPPTQLAGRAVALPTLAPVHRSWPSAPRLFLALPSVGYRFLFLPRGLGLGSLSNVHTFPACGHWSSEHMVFRQELMRPLFPTMRTRWTTGRCGSPSVSFLLPRLVPEHRSPLSPFLAFLPSPDFAHLRLAHRPLACISIAAAPCRSVNIPKRVVSPSRSWPPFSSGFDFMPPQSQLVVQRGSTSYAPLSFTNNYYAGRRRISPSPPFPQHARD
ncbi:hypothetical protein BD311DRAFT_751764 [Dichomitus squalens]|uniref:Uncharacterized protein n=1 Tax=Dichomitus squalens TaxID=114155 RepID=A0A4Q9MVC1_9APHY|nr:hypothetical protein BD311DRAFT_751764 [Dichomitus squalens]